MDAVPDQSTTPPWERPGGAGTGGAAPCSCETSRQSSCPWATRRCPRPTTSPSSTTSPASRRHLGVARRARPAAPGVPVVVLRRLRARVRGRARLPRAGAPRGGRGLGRFRRCVPADLAALVDEVRVSRAAFQAAVAATPTALLHGDWKFGNLGRARRWPDGAASTGPTSGRVRWRTSSAWYLALNRARLPIGHTKERGDRRLHAALERAGILPAAGGSASSACACSARWPSSAGRRRSGPRTSCGGGATGPRRRSLAVTDRPETTLRAAYSATGADWQSGPTRVYDRLAEVLIERAPVPVAGAPVVDIGAGTGAAGRAAPAAGGPVRHRRGPRRRHAGRRSRASAVGRGRCTSAGGPGRGRGPRRRRLLPEPPGRPRRRAARSSPRRETRWRCRRRGLRQRRRPSGEGGRRDRAATASGGKNPGGPRGCGPRRFPDSPVWRPPGRLPRRRAWAMRSSTTSVSRALD